MGNSKMEDKFFCSAKARPIVCKLETNVCCFNCKFNNECIAMAKNYNKTHTIKCTIPCTSSNVSSDEMCGFAC